MKFHPVISIALGTVAAFIFLSFIGVIFTYHIFNLSSESFWYHPTVIFSFLLGGFIATNFAKDKKIIYSFIEGLVLGVFVFIQGLISQLYDIKLVIFAVILFALISGVGGYIGKSWGEPIQKIMSIFKRFKNDLKS